MRTTIFLSSCLALLACSGSDPSTTKPTTAATESLDLSSASKHYTTAQFEFTVLGSPVGLNTVTNGINDLGVIVGSEQDVLGINTPEEPVVFWQGKGTVIQTGSVYAGFDQINNLGGAATSYYSSPDYVWHAAIYDLGSKHWTYLPSPGIPGKDYNGALGINDLGVVVGFSSNAEYVNTDGWIWDGRGYTVFDVPGAYGGECRGTVPLSVNNEGQVVGYYSDDTCNWHGFLKVGSRYTTIDPPNVACGSLANAINNVGVIAGTWSPADCSDYGFLLKDGTYTVFDFPPSFGEGAWVAGINDLGVIVGYFTDPAGIEHGYVGVPTRGN